MVFSAAAPKPLQVKTKGEENLLPQPRETGQVVPEGQNGTTTAVTKDGPVVKPWAHFVAGGYENHKKPSQKGKTEQFS
jgi:hypothetical protein